MPTPVIIVAYSIVVESDMITVAYTAPASHPVTGEAYEHNGTCVLTDGEGALASPGWTEDDLAAAVLAKISGNAEAVTVSLAPRRGRQ